MYGTLLHLSKNCCDEDQADCFMWHKNIAGQDTIGAGSHDFTPHLYAATQMPVHNLKIIEGAKGDPGVHSTGVQPQN